MKIKAERKALADTVAWVSQAVPKKAQVPATAGIHITATKKNIVLRAFDYEVSHAAVLAAKVGKVGEALVPAAFLRGVLAGFKTADIEMEIDGTTFTVSAGSARYSCRTLPLADYPNLPAVPEVVGHINADALAEAVGLTAWASDQNPPATNLVMLSAVHIEGAGDELTMAATDRFVISEIVSRYTGTSDFTANVPGLALAAAVKGMTDSVAICHEGGLFGLSDGIRTVTLRCLDVEYPAYRKALRPPGSLTATLDGEDLLDAVKRTSVLAEKTGLITLEVGEDGLVVSVPAYDAGESNEQIDAEVEGGALSAGMAPGQLAAALGALGGGPVTLDFEPEQDGTVKRLVYLRTKREDLTVAVMPKRLAGAR